jgi:hypothetical protein
MQIVTYGPAKPDAKAPCDMCPVFIEAVRDSIQGVGPFYAAVKFGQKIGQPLWTRSGMRGNGSCGKFKSRTFGIEECTLVPGFY